MKGCVCPSCTTFQRADTQSTNFQRRKGRKTGLHTAWCTTHIRSCTCTFTNLGTHAHNHDTVLIQRLPLHHRVLLSSAKVFLHSVETSAGEGKISVGLRDGHWQETNVTSVMSDTVESRFEVRRFKVRGTQTCFWRQRIWRRRLRASGQIALIVNRPTCIKGRVDDRGDSKVQEVFNIDSNGNQN